jgi:nucleotide-binding universal stress UspA family protein
MKNLLVPVDFSPVTGHVIDSAISLARALSAQVHLLHVVQPPVVTGEFALPVEALQEAISTSEKAAREKLSEYVKMFSAAKVEAEARVMHGPPVPLIREEAARVHADCVIMGSHGHGKLYDLLVGSTANGVLKNAKYGVLILPPVDKKA